MDNIIYFLGKSNNAIIIARTKEQVAWWRSQGYIEMPKGHALKCFEIEKSEGEKWDKSYRAWVATKYAGGRYK